jgi:acetylornithine deacetylase/succinyl-diaminopimelate desuccinylase-like protein
MLAALVTIDSTAVLDAADSQGAEHLEELKEYLRIPSISTDPAYAKDVDRCADWLLAKMADAGLEAEKIETSGHPLVYGEWLGAEGKPTVLFYGHYDVQPVDPVDLWRHPPFEPTEEGENLVARGATDDKGQSFAHLKAVATLLAERGELPVNVKFIVEGEEESGGEAIETFVDEDAGRRLAADAVVISDSSMLAPGRPSLLAGLRGMCYMELKVTGPNRDLHSGTFGGAVENPLNALATIVSKLRDPETGRIQIPGFYDDVRALSDGERAEIASLPFDEQEYERDLGIPEVRGEAGYTTLERTSVRPTCDVNGMWGGYEGLGAKTVLPSYGGAKISMRLVPDQDPDVVEEQFRRFVADNTPAGVEVEIEAHHGAYPVLIEAAGPIAEAALSAMEEIWGAPPVRTREGGSIPIVSTFSRVLGCPVLLLGFGLGDDNLHSPNEKFNISHYHNGIRSIIRLLDLAGSH